MVSPWRHHECAAVADLRGRAGELASGSLLGNLGDDPGIDREAAEAATARRAVVAQARVTARDVEQLPDRLLAADLRVERDRAGETPLLEQRAGQRHHHLGLALVMDAAAQVELPLGLAAGRAAVEPEVHLLEIHQAVQRGRGGRGDGLPTDLDRAARELQRRQQVLAGNDGRAVVVDVDLLLGQLLQVDVGAPGLGLGGAGGQALEQVGRGAVHQEPGLRADDVDLDLVLRHGKEPPLEEPRIPPWGVHAELRDWRP